jgi:lysophospholipid acyltransferase (LPLAT)-like uncharacterized protein
MKLRWAEPVLTRVGALMVRALAATWRVRERGVEHRRALGDAPFIYVLWHSRILPLLFHHRNQGIVLLISRHRDGGYLADLGERWGYRSVRGSSKRGGAAGLLGIVRELEGGAVVAITPDGPQGPAEKVKPGAVAAAQHAGVPLVPLAATASRAWWTQSWDRFCIPKPFARVDIVYGPPIVVGPGKEGVASAVATVEQSIQQIMKPA